MSGGSVVRRLSDLAGPGAGGSSRELRHSDGPWLRAAGGADGLAAELGPARVELTVAHEGLVAGAGALKALAELAVVRESWQRRIEAARGECGVLAGSLRAVARAQGETNESVRSSFAPVTVRPGGER
ncbi:hypothetical protein ABZ371_11650 [Streptomyces sp. NPDC005899]|uniref:hypothetical protein n=1 Tax=Streptomyces sp. NPDC005899 TaxID=3155716 RepID=UPI003400DEFC